MSSIKDLERGELTPVGINEAYGLGQNIREDYSGFINDVYQASDVYLNSNASITLNGLDYRVLRNRQQNCGERLGHVSRNVSSDSISTMEQQSSLDSDSGVCNV